MSSTIVILIPGLSTHNHSTAFRGRLPKLYSDFLSSPVTSKGSRAVPVHFVPMERIGRPAEAGPVRVLTAEHRSPPECNTDVYISIYWEICMIVYKPMHQYQSSV